MLSSDNNYRFERPASSVGKAKSCQKKTRAWRVKSLNLKFLILETNRNDSINSWPTMQGIRAIDGPIDVALGGSINRSTVNVGIRA